MRSKATIIVLCTAAAALSLCLAGCGNNQSNEEKSSSGESTQQVQSAAKADNAIEPYIEVNGQTFSADEWNKKVSGNSLAAESYVGKQVTVVAPVSFVVTDGSLTYGDTGLYDCPVGYINLSFGSGAFYVDIPEQYKDVAANLSSNIINGDYVKVTGTITDASVGFNLINGPVENIPNSGPITIEKL